MLVTKASANYKVPVLDAPNDRITIDPSKPFVSTKNRTVEVPISASKELIVSKFGERRVMKVYAVGRTP